jgi:hypothetical protein
MDIVVGTEEEGEDVAAIGVEAMPAMVNLVCEVDEVDIVVAAANLKQQRSSHLEQYRISMDLIMVYQCACFGFPTFSIKAWRFSHCFL